MTYSSKIMTQGVILGCLVTLAFASGKRQRLYKSEEKMSEPQSEQHMPNAFRHEVVSADKKKKIETYLMDPVKFNPDFREFNAWLNARNNRESTWRSMSWIGNLIVALKKKGFTVIKPLGKHGSTKTVFLARKNGTSTKSPARYVAKFTQSDHHETEVRFAAEIRNGLGEELANKLIIPTVCFIKAKGYSLRSLNSYFPQNTQTCEIQPRAIQDNINFGDVKPMRHLCVKTRKEESTVPCEDCAFCKGTVQDLGKLCTALYEFSQGKVSLESDAYKPRQMGIWCGNPVYMDIGYPVGKLGAKARKDAEQNTTNMDAVTQPMEKAEMEAREDFDRIKEVLKALKRSRHEKMKMIAEAPLLSGWVEKVDDEGKTYYAHTSTETITVNDGAPEIGVMFVDTNGTKLTQIYRAQSDFRVGDSIISIAGRSLLNKTRREQRALWDLHVGSDGLQLGVKRTNVSQNRPVDLGLENALAEINEKIRNTWVANQK